MGFFKRPSFVHPDAGFPGKAFQASQQLQQQPSALDSHRLAELRALSMRMENLNLQMEQLAASVKTQKQTGMSPRSMPQAGAMNDRVLHRTGSGESQHPGPCPFPVHEEIPRFVELDDADPRASQAAFSAAETRAQASPEAGPQGMSQAHLEHMLREGSQARARSASPAQAAFASSPAVSSASGFVNHGQPHATHFSQGMQGDPYQTYGAASTQMPAWAHSVPRAGDGMQFNPMSVAGLPGEMPGYLARGHPGNPGDYLHQQSAQMGRASSPFMPPVSQFGNAQMPGQRIHPFSGGMQPGQNQLGYQFPNAFGLEQGPHRPGFGNGFSMQQMPSVLGQIGAQLSMPSAQHMGGQAYAGSNFGY